MQKIIVAIQDEATRNNYSQVLKDAHFEVIPCNSGKRVIDLATYSTPDLIIVDENLADFGGIEVLKVLKSNPKTRKVPVIVYSYLGKEETKTAAINLEAKDFFVGMVTSPGEIVSRVKIHLGFQKVYYISPSFETLKVVKEMKKDMGYSESLQCPKCGTQMMISLMRDLSKGYDYFKISFVCPSCGYTE